MLLATDTAMSPQNAADVSIISLKVVRWKRSLLLGSGYQLWPLRRRPGLTGKSTAAASARSSSHGSWGGGFGQGNLLADPYTRALLDAVPSADPRLRKIGRPLDAE